MCFSVCIIWPLAWSLELGGSDEANCDFLVMECGTHVPEILFASLPCCLTTLDGHAEL